MNRWTKILVVLTLLTMIMGLVASCSPKAVKEPATAAPTTAPAAPAAPIATTAPAAQAATAAPAAPAAPAADVPAPATIDMFHFYSEGAGLQPQLVEQTARFEAENPGWKVNWTWGGSEALQKQRARINAGDPPDAMLGNDATVAIWAREGVIQPLDRWLAGQNYEKTAVWKDTFQPGLITNGRIADGKMGAGIYGIPDGMHFSGIFYNKKLFQEKGYQIPKTWTELEQLCDKIQAEDKIPCFTGDNFNGYNARVTLYVMRRLLGGQLVYDTAMNKAGTSWTAPGFLEAATKTQDFYEKYYMPGWEGNQWPTGQVDWANGGAAMIFMPSWLPSELLETKAEDFEMDIFPVPAIEGGKGEQLDYELKFNGWAIPVGSKQPDAAMYFIKYLTGMQVQSEKSTKGQLAAVVKGLPLPEPLKSFESVLEEGQVVRFAGGLDADAAEWQSKVFYPLNDQLSFGQITPEQFIEQLQKEHKAYYAGKPVAAPAADVPAPATIDIFHFYSEGAGLQPQLVEQTARFEAENPGWKIDWTWGGSEAMQKLRARINAGDPPDAFIQNDGNIAILAREGVTQPLDRWLAGQNYEKTAVWKDTFQTGLIANGTIADGKMGAGIYGIPDGMHFSGIFYNKKLFQEKGYQIPKTWTELEQLCDKIQAEDKIPCFTGDNYNSYNARVTLYVMRRLLGGQLVYDTAMNKAGTSWTAPGFLEAATKTQDFFKKYYMPGWEGNQWPTGQVDWANGGAAMIFMPSWLPSELLETKAEDFEMDIFPVPAIEGGKGEQLDYELKFNGWAIPVGSKQPDAAMYFIKYLTGEQVQSEKSTAGQLAAVVKGLPLPEPLKSFESVLEEGQFIRFAGGLDADAAEWQNKVFMPLDDQLLFGQITPEQFIEQLQKEHEAYYASKQ